MVCYNVTLLHTCEHIGICTKLWCILIFLWWRWQHDNKPYLLSDFSFSTNPGQSYSMWAMHELKFVVTFAGWRSISADSWVKLLFLSLVTQSGLIGYYLINFQHRNTKWNQSSNTSRTHTTINAVITEIERTLQKKMTEIYDANVKIPT